MEKGRHEMKTGFNRRVLAAAAIASVLALAEAGAVESGEMTAKSSIKEVVVYSDRAVIERSAPVELQAGRSSLVFDGLPEGLDPSSLQVRGKGQVVLEDIVFRTKYLSQIPDERIKGLETERDSAQAKLLATTDRISRSGSEKAFLEKIVGKVTSAVEGSTELSPEKWVQMIKFYRERLASLDEEIRAAERDQKIQRSELDRILKELGALSAGRQKKSNQAMVIVMSEKGGKAEIALSYVVRGPSWTPVYDIRVDSEKRQLSISYNAYITQNTGEDWSAVRLSLSTARPEIGGDQPELEPWYIQVYKPEPRNQAVSRAKAAPVSKKDESANMFQMFEADALAGAAPVEEPSPMAYRGADAEKGAVAVVFAVKGSTTIDSDAARHRVSISQGNFPAAFRYSAAPKLSPYAYLKAKVKNETDFPFLPGASKVFLDGAFVADSVIDLVSTGEEFWTFLGVDESVKIEYKLLKRFKDEQGVFEKKNRYVYQYETTVTNNKKADVELVLWDQLPISNDQKLVVKLIDPKYQKDTDVLKKNNTDMLEWLLNLKPAESRKVPFSFSVEYPMDVSVQGL
jgi:uncharacterized protein (TIGR02231 family)